jgi:hypothetical protein
MDFVGFVDQLGAMKKLHTQLSDCICSLNRAYRLHKYVADTESREEEKRERRAKQSSVDVVYIAVHSLTLHLQAALKKSVLVLLVQSCRALVCFSGFKLLIKS